jgi:hypothetical protein
MRRIFINEGERNNRRIMRTTGERTLRFALFAESYGDKIKDNEIGAKTEKEAKD